MPANPYLAVDKRILADSGTSGRIEEDLFTLCDEIGPRFAGTDGYRRAAAFMRRRFEACKLERAALEPFEFTAWRRGDPARLTVALPGALADRAIPCYALPYSAATAARGITAGLVDIGAGSAEDIEAQRRKIKGRFVLTTSAGAHRTAIYARCESLGAAGFILGNSLEGMALNTGTIADGRGGAIPAVSIGCESMRQIQRLTRKHRLRFTLTTDAALEQATTWNVVGELTGTEYPDELVLMGGHLDSHEIGPCAFDNGAGALMVIEAARLLAKQRRHLKRTVRFIGFAAEEIGLLGSHYHARTHAAALRKGRFMLNCDTPALGRPRGLAFHKCPKAAPYIAKLADQMETEIVCQNRAHCHSDHYPFILQGLPTAGVGGGRFGSPVQHFVHMAADTPEKICISDLRDAAAFAARILLRAASDESWPRMRRSAKEVKAWRAESTQP